MEGVADDCREPLSAPDDHGPHRASGDVSVARQPREPAPDSCVAYVSQLWGLILPGRDLCAGGVSCAGAERNADGTGDVGLLRGELILHNKPLYLTDVMALLEETTVIGNIEHWLLKAGIEE